VDDILGFGIPGHIQIMVRGTVYPFYIAVYPFGPCRSFLNFIPRSVLPSIKLDDVSLNTCTTEMAFSGGKRSRLRFLDTTDELLATFEITTATTFKWAHQYDPYVHGEGPPPNLPRQDGLTTV
jgi:hypothetical protein